MRATRLVTLDDARSLAELLRVNRAFLAPWEPTRDDDYVTDQGQSAAIRFALERCEQGTALPSVILDESGRVAGRITLSDIVRGPFQSCHLGYWVKGLHHVSARSMFTFGPTPPPELSRARTRAAAPDVSAETSGAIAGSATGVWAGRV